MLRNYNNIHVDLNFVRKILKLQNLEFSTARTLRNVNSNGVPDQACAKTVISEFSNLQSQIVDINGQDSATSDGQSALNKNHDSGLQMTICICIFYNFLYFLVFCRIIISYETKFFY